MGTPQPPFRSAAGLTCAGLVMLAALVAAAVAAPAAEWQTTTVPATDKTAPAADGPAWYRCFVRVQDNMTGRAEGDLMADSVTLSLGGVRGAVAVYLNGQKIAEAADLPDEPRRRFKVPKGILEPGVFNVIALRLD